MNGWIIAALILTAFLVVFGVTLGLLLSDAGDRQDEAERESGEMQ